MSPAPEAVSPAREAQLLESDCDEEPPAPPPPPVISRCEDFYLDPKLDYGNLRVSTLYYPGRPQSVYTMWFFYLNFIMVSIFVIGNFFLKVPIISNAHSTQGVFLAC